MIAKIRTFLTRGLLALCLASGLTAQTIEPAAAAPIAGMTSSPKRQLPIRFNKPITTVITGFITAALITAMFISMRHGGTIARFIAIGLSITCLAAVSSAGTSPATAWYLDRIGAATADLNSEQPMNLPVRLCSVKRSYGV